MSPGNIYDEDCPRYYIDTRSIPGADASAFHVLDRRSGAEMGRYLFEDQAKDRLRGLLSAGTEKEFASVGYLKKIAKLTEALSLARDTIVDMDDSFGLAVSHLGLELSEKAYDGVVGDSVASRSAGRAALAAIEEALK